MNKSMRWFDYITINIYQIGLGIASGILTPLLLPYLVAVFMPIEYKNSYLATVRVIGLTVAMMIQPLAGMLSDRSSHPLGRRRPFIILSAVANIICLLGIGLTPLLLGTPLDASMRGSLGISAAYLALIAAVIVMQFFSNFGQAAFQGIIPDVVPANQRGRASGVKAIFELIPSLVVIFIGPMIDRGQIWLPVVIIVSCFGISALISLFGIRETPQPKQPAESLREPFWRFFLLAAIFVAISQGAVFLTRSAGGWLSAAGAALPLQVVLVGAAGLLAMAGSIFIGVYFGARTGIGKEATQQSSFIWWVINRLLFLSAIGSIQGFAQYYLADVMHVEKPASATTMLLAVVAVFLMISAVSGGYLADRIGRKKLVGVAGGVAALGTLVLLLAPNMTVVIIAGCIIGLGTGTFMATNWALGTDLVPAKDAGRYLGISNLAGAGAGIVGAGIGGPLADFFNKLQPGLGYIIIFALYGALFLISVLTLVKVKPPLKS